MKLKSMQGNGKSAQFFNAKYDGEIYNAPKPPGGQTWN